VLAPRTREPPARAARPRPRLPEAGHPEAVAAVSPQSRGASRAQYETGRTAARARTALRRRGALTVGRSSRLHRSMSAAAAERTFVVDPFCKRQFDEASKKTPFINCAIEDFEAKVNELAGAEPKLHDGYAPFCKHLFVPNFVGATVNVLPIMPENESLVTPAAPSNLFSALSAGALVADRRSCFAMQLRSGYSARTEKELPVLSRWFPADAVGTAPAAKFLDLILYSREQASQAVSLFPLWRVGGCGCGWPRALVKS
jgi:hypothetical protein